MTMRLLDKASQPSQYSRDPRGVTPTGLAGASPDPSESSQGIKASIANKTVTYDFERLMEGATKLKCSEFGDAIIKNMG